MKNKKSIFVSIVNYGDEQLQYLQQVVDSLNSFQKYDTTIFVTTNINLEGIINGVDKFIKIDSLPSWELLPLESRKVLLEQKGKYDYYIYTENDHLWLENHVDNYIRYETKLPDDYISGLIQYEYDSTGNYYPAYHAHYDWDYNSVINRGGLTFAHFTNVHQACFLISNKKLGEISSKFNLNDFYSNDEYSVKCKINTEIYKWSGYKKVICISEFSENLIHHLPNVYIHGDKGRNKNQRSDDFKMHKSLYKLFDKVFNI